MLATSISPSRIRDSSDTRELSITEPDVLAWAPRGGLNALVQLDLDLRAATILVRGSRTPSTFETLLRIIARMVRIGGNLRITIDLAVAEMVDVAVLDRLHGCRSWHVSGVREAAGEQRAAG